MINLEELTVAINEIIGTDKFCVYLNSNAFPDDIGDRTVVTLSALRVPFGFTQEEFDAESLSLTLTFDLPCDVYGDEVVIRDQALQLIQEKLLGRQTFKVEEEKTNVYIVNMFLEQQPPTNPYADSGRITQQIVLTGNALVQNKNCGAIVGNDVKISISTYNKNDENDKYYYTLLKTTRASSLQVGLDSNVPLSSGKTRVTQTGTSHNNSKSLTFIYTGQKIEENFLKIAEGIAFDVNTKYWYKAEYPDFSIEVPFLLTSVTSQDSAGVYLQYTLNIQTEGDATEQKVEE